jgi:hypothetical protein
MSTPILVLGDDVAVQLTLTDANGVAVDVSGATSVKAALVKMDRTAILAGPYLCSAGATGAAWSSGVVVASVVGTDTAGLSVSQAQWEVQVIKSATVTTYLDTQRTTLIKGLIP